MLFRSLFLGIFLSSAFVVTAAAETVAFMIQEHSCAWCARWNDEISHIYPKTEEGKAAPLHGIDIHAKRPDNTTFARKLNFTPTFVLVVGRAEASRTEGYPGEDFFWGFLDQRLSQANVEISQS